MAEELTGPQRRELREALMAAFPDWMTLARMTSEYLDLSLGTVTSQMKDLPGYAFDLIEWARSNGRVIDLMVAARNANPGNPKLFTFVRKLGLTAADQSNRALEAFVSSNTTMVDSRLWREKLAAAEWTVCRVDIDRKGKGTGFLIGPDAVLTNHHVVDALVEGDIKPSQVSCLFDYHMINDRQASPGHRVALAADDAVIASSPPSPVDLEPDPKSGDPAADELDFALLRLAEAIGQQSVGQGEEGAKRGWLPVPVGPIDYTVMTGVAILQHPHKVSMKLALGSDQALTVNGAGNRLRHTVPTQPGSSGSPVFNADWDLVALHHSGDPDLIKPEFNEAIPIGPISQHQALATYLDAIDD